MGLDSAISHLLKAKRISAPSQSYAKDNPAEWAKVKAYLEGGARPSGVVTEMGLGLMEVEDARRPVVPPDPPPGNRYTDINFASGKYLGEGVSSVFVAAGSDPRVSSWGGLEPQDYDSRGCTQDASMRVHLFHPSDRGLPANPAGGAWASWQELRTTDGPWTQSIPDLAKSSLNAAATPAVTWGPDSFSIGDERWFAWDILFPLNINGVSFNPVLDGGPNGDFHILAFLHDQGAHTAIGTGVEPQGGSHPKYHTFLATPNQESGGPPFFEVNLVQLTNSNGTRFTSSYNVWHEFVLGMKVASAGSPGNSLGWFEIWHNGVNVLPRNFRPTVGVGESGLYCQMQNYTGYPTSFVSGESKSAVVYGGFRAGMTRTDVQMR